MSEITNFNFQKYLRYIFKAALVLHLLLWCIVSDAIS